MQEIYLDFVVERHRIWERRQQGFPPPWTNDPILRCRKMTNVFRVLDQGTQFLIRELLDPNISERDALARCFLYRYTNLPETWVAMRDALGRYPLEEDMGEKLVRIIQSYRLRANRVFSGAYMIVPQPNISGDKVVHAVELARYWMFARAEDFFAARTQKERFEVLQSVYGVGKFMSMQILTDYGYSPQCGEDRENQFIALGPGALKGAKMIQPEADTTDTMKLAYSSVLDLKNCPSLQIGDHLRLPSLMDIQNTLCEFSKYGRYMNRPQSNYEYAPAHPGRQETPIYPQHW